MMSLVAGSEETLGLSPGPHEFSFIFSFDDFFTCLFVFWDWRFLWGVDRMTVDYLHQLLALRYAAFHGFFRLTLQWVSLDLTRLHVRRTGVLV